MGKEIGSSSGLQKVGSLMSIPDTGMLESIQASARDRVASPSPNVPDRYPTMFKPGVNGGVASAGDLVEFANFVMT